MTSRWGDVVEGSLSLVLELVHLRDGKNHNHNMYDGPQQYNFEPVRRERANEELPRTDGGQSQLNAWSEEIEWRVTII